MNITALKVVFEKYWQIFAHNDGFLLQPM